MTAFGVQVPLTFDSADGFTMLKTIKRAVKQNFKMLLLTNPGERIMIPDYGVGIKTFLFENNLGSTTQSDIIAAIEKQTKKYLPIIQINQILFAPMNGSPNGLAMQITYVIPDLGIQDLIEFTI
tara:strand:- start:107 stop:478 length:372 start_codon:yes stop_codon:yes gene_type:complete